MATGERMTWNSPSHGTFTASVAWTPSNVMSTRWFGVRLIAHETGHNLGLGHAQSRDFGNEPLGPLGVQGTLSEYGDIASEMGQQGFFSAPHAVSLNWLNLGSNYLVVESNGSFTIQNYEARPAGLKALKVRRGSGNNAWLWIEYRQNAGIYDSQLPVFTSQVFDGALIHYEDSYTIPGYTNLLDFFQPAEPPADAKFFDPALPAGTTWTDPYSDLSITVGAATSSSLDVTITYAKIAAPTRRHNPRGRSRSRSKHKYQSY
jgi:hypothetical protein